MVDGASRSFTKPVRARLREPMTWIDLALAIGLSLLALGVGSYRNPGLDAPVTIALVTLPLALRRRWPLGVLAIVALGVVVTRGSAGFVEVAAVAVAGFSAGDRDGDRAVSAAAALAAAAAIALGIAAQEVELWIAIAVAFVILVPSWIVGDAVRSQRVAAGVRAAAARRAEEVRVAALAQAAVNERRHVARELHDVVAHAVSVMLIQAGAARQVVATSPRRAEEALLAVEATGRDAMAELRRLLGALSDEGESGGLAPQPGVAQLDALVTRVREAGLPVELEIEGTVRPLAASTDVSAYRIVQEALTNALRHARRAPTLVRLVYEPTQVRLEVLDDGPGAPPGPESASGRGIAGMHERAVLAGGRLEVGPRLGGGFAVRAWLPLSVEPA